MSAEDGKLEAWAEDIALKAEAAGIARATVHSYGDCLAGLTLLRLIKEQDRRAAVTRMCLEGARVTGATFSGTVRVTLLVAGVIEP